MLRPGDYFGRYQIESELGRGGMGVVFLARDDQVGRSVALKVLGSDLTENDEFRARFVREMRIAATLEHPNVVPVYETGQTNEHLFIAMRCIDGPDLSEVIAERGALPVERVIRLAAMVSAALDEAHAHGLVHRDVKPANVLLATAAGGEHAYLADFGLSREAASDSGLTNTGQWMGTADYVSPEQLDGKPVSARSDIYSLTCLIYSMLTGRLPYEGSLVAKLKGHALEPMPDLPMAVPNRGAVERVLARGCAKDPEARFPSAGDLGRALQAALEGQPAPTLERSVATGAALSGIATQAATLEVPSDGSATTRPRAPAASATPARQTVLEPERWREPSPPPPDVTTPSWSRWLALGAAGLVLVAVGGGAAISLNASSDSGEPAKSASAAVPTTSTPTTTTETVKEVTTVKGETTTVTAPSPPTPSGSRQFHAPSGNVSCEIAGGGAQCSVASIGTTFVLPGDGAAAYTTADVTLPRGTGSLSDFGTAISLGAVTCTIPASTERKGVVCENSTTGHGFEASRHATRQRVF